MQFSLNEHPHMQDMQLEKSLSKYYDFDSESGVWVRKDRASIPYTDGDSETTLSNILNSIQDLSSSSLELETHCTDWSTKYHLSSRRSNLLRPLKKEISGVVLEIGAGCGAVTRFLSENAKVVLALEGSLNRAKICAQRCRGQANVYVLCENFVDFKFDLKFDTIFLIGVLEYARIYYGAQAAQKGMLNQTADLLKENGALVLAIENQLGLKYFAGAKEDHLSRPWISVGDTYPPNDAITFGRIELEGLLHSSNLKYFKHYIPVPDYKLPVSIIDANGLDAARDNNFNPATFLTQSAATDYQGADPNILALETAWNAIERNKLSLDLANSFLVVASKQELETPTTQAIVYHYGGHRRSEFLKETLIYGDSAGLHIKRTPLYPKSSSSTCNHRYSANWKNEEVCNGELLLDELFYLINQDNWSINNLANWATPWLKELISKLPNPNKPLDELLFERLPNEYLDATPFNLIRTADGQLKFIDLEWIDHKGPTLLHVLVRGLIGCFDKITSVATPSFPTQSLTFWNLLCLTLEELKITTTLEQIKEALAEEINFREFVTGVPSTLSQQELQSRTLLARQNLNISELINTKNSLAENKKKLDLEIDQLTIQHFSSLYQQQRLNKLIKLEQIDSARQVKISRLSLDLALAKDKLKQNNLPKLPWTHSAVEWAQIFCDKSRAKKLIKEHSFKGFLRIIKQSWAINKSGLFDSKFYVRTNPDLAQLPHSPLLHYIAHGAVEGRQPNALFDGRWYCLTNKISSNGVINPLYHYIKAGSQNHLKPHPLFDSIFYRRQLGVEKILNDSELGHYLAIGRSCDLSPHPLFSLTHYSPAIKNCPPSTDPLSHYIENWHCTNQPPHPLFSPSYYLLNNPDVKKLNMNPLIHYCLHGYKEQRDPSPEFSVAGYYKFNIDVQKLEIEPLGHYLIHGTVEGRKTISVPAYVDLILKSFIKPEVSTKSRLTPREISFQEWLQIKPQNLAATARVDIVIPVYKGRLETLACIYSVLNAPVQVDYRLIVINDQSPDVELSKELEKYAALGLFTLITNKNNLGFVATVNRGMQQSEDSDILLLNSDTEVFPGWLDRLYDAAYSHKNIATVTPLSNAATICSYPVFCADYPNKLEVSPQEIDQIAAKLNFANSVDTPTAVGFCMYIKRDCLIQVGYFDQEKFGRGYGEENEFCLRASKFGWRNIITPNTYVLHYGSTSFGDTERLSRVDQALKIINHEYPTYLSEVSKFVEIDPLKEARLKIDLARLRSSLLPKRFLFISHRRGGGTLRHMEYLAEGLFKQGISVIYLESHPDIKGLASLRMPGFSASELSSLSSLNFDNNPELLSALIDLLEISHIHIHSLVDFDAFAGDWIRQACELSKKSYDITAHDYAWFCPRINMIDDSNIFCGGAELTKCASCVEKNSSNWGRISISEFVKTNSALLSKARKVICPSEDTRDRLIESMIEVQAEFKPHSCDLIDTTITNLRPKSSQKRRIAILGAIGIHKGSLILEGCLKDATNRNLALEFVVIGFSNNQKKLESYSNIRFTGPYKDTEAVQLLVEQDCDLCLFPAVWPETFSYTLSIAFNAGVLPVTFNFGAIAERIKKIGWGVVLDTDLLTNCAKLNDALLEIELNKEIPLDSLKQDFVDYPNLVTDYYNM